MYLNVKIKILNEVCVYLNLFEPTVFENIPYYRIPNKCMEMFLLTIFYCLLVLILVLILVLVLDPPNKYP